MPRPEPRREDDEEAAKAVDALSKKVVDAKKKLAKVRADMDDLDEKKTALQAEIDQLMPQLQEARAAKNSAMGQIAGTRLPQLWLDRVKELKARRSHLPGGCATEAALQRAIRDAEMEISHGSLTLKQEKAALEKIRELKRGRSVVAEFERDQAILDQVLEQHKAQQAEQRPVTGNLDELKNATLEKQVVVDKLMAARQEVHASRGTLNASHEELRATLDRHFADARMHQSDAPKAVARFFATVQDLDATLKSEREERRMTGEQRAEKAAKKRAEEAAKAEAERAAKEATAEAARAAEADAKAEAARKAEAEAIERAAKAAEQAEEQAVARAKEVANKERKEKKKAREKAAKAEKTAKQHLAESQERQAAEQEEARQAAEAAAAEKEQEEAARAAAQAAEVEAKAAAAKEKKDKKKSKAKEKKPSNSSSGGTKVAKGTKESTSSGLGSTLCYTVFGASVLLAAWVAVAFVQSRDNVL